MKSANWHHGLSSDGGRESRATIYSFIVTAIPSGIDPVSYRRNVLSRIAEDPINRIEDLLPWNLAAKLAGNSSRAA